MAAMWRYHVTRPGYRLARGEEAIRARDWTGAEAEAARLEAAGYPDHAHLLRGVVLHARQQPALALAELNQLDDHAPMAIRLQALAVSGKCLLELGALREAERAYAFIVEQRPDDTDARRRLAVVAYDMGQLGAAVEHLREVARLDPVDALPHRLIGLIYKDMDQNELAVAAYQEALRRGRALVTSEATPGRDTYWWWQSYTPLPDTVVSEIRLELAEVLVKLARYAEALAAIEGQAAGNRGDAVRLAVARAASFRGLGRKPEAAAVVDQALAVIPATELYRVRGQLDLDDGRYADAVRALEQAVRLAPADYQAHFLLAGAYAGVNRKDDASRETARAEAIRRDLDRITQLSREAMDRPWDPIVRRQLAELADRLGKPELAAVWRKAAAACSAPAPRP